MPPAHFWAHLNTLLNTFNHLKQFPKKVKTRYPLRDNGFLWSCWADSNCRPHPYQLTKGCFFLLLVIVPCRFQSLAPQGSSQILPAPYCFLPFLEKDCFSVSVSVLCRFLWMACRCDLIPSWGQKRQGRGSPGPIQQIIWFSRIDQKRD